MEQEGANRRTPGTGADEPQPSGEVTRLLPAWAAGDAAAGARLWQLVYDDLRRIARRHMARERDDHTLDPTGLVHEAWMQIEPRHADAAANRRQYLALASKVMRSLLVDHARRNATQKRGGGTPRLSLEHAGVSAPDGVDALVIDDLMQRLHQIDSQLASVAELRLFGGLDADDASAALGLAKRTYERRWRTASTWILRELEK